MTLPLPESPRRLVYLGTPALAVPTLTALVEAGHEVALVITRPDARRGRGTTRSPSPVKAEAQRLGIPVSHEIADVLDVEADLGVVVAYGRLIPTSVLAELPMVNLHFSLLPRWRGAAPVERALLEGDAETGVCIMDVAEALDEGDVFARATVPITADSTLDGLRDELVEAGTELLLDGLANGFGPGEPQRGEVRYAEKITKDELRLDFGAAASRVRAVVALGGAWTTFRSKRFKVLGVAATDLDRPLATPGTLVAPEDRKRGPLVAAGDAWLELTRVQPEGKAAMDGRQWLAGARLADDERLGT